MRKMQNETNYKALEQVGNARRAHGMAHGKQRGVARVYQKTIIANLIEINFEQF